MTHSRGGLVLRNLVERGTQFGDLSRRFKLGRAVLVASPNDGTPLATPQRWDDTVGWLANVLEMFPDNPFTTGAAFVANGLVWLANHALGDLPGLHAMDGDGELIAALQAPPGPPPMPIRRWSPITNPTGAVLQRLLDAGIDQFFASANDLVVPSEGGWRIDRAEHRIHSADADRLFRARRQPAGDTVTHVNFFSQPETADFLVNALLGRPAAAERHRSAQEPAGSAAAPGRLADAVRPTNGKGRRSSRSASGRRPESEDRRRRTTAHHRRQRRPDVRSPRRCCSATTMRFD